MIDKSDEGVRAALEALVKATQEFHEAALGHLHDSDFELDHFLGKAEAELSVTALPAALAALSTPVPEEGLPRGSASAADLRELADDLRANPTIEGLQRLVDRTKVESDRLYGSWMRSRRGLAPEAGAGVASALPSPLPSQGEPVAEIVAERDRLKAALVKIDGIRNSIIGFQNVGWSEHIYPLVAALQEAGFDGLGYKKARENVDTLLAVTEAAEKKAAAAEARADRAEEALHHALRGIEVAQLGLNRDGVQHAKLKQVEASLRTILKEFTNE